MKDPNSAKLAPTHLRCSKYPPFYRRSTQNIVLTVVLVDMQILHFGLPGMEFGERVGV